MAKYYKRSRRLFAIRSGFNVSLLFAPLVHSLVSFTSFRFAANGVCISPARFVDVDRPQTFTMKNVPGEGDCMFLAVALATLASMGLGGNDALLRAISHETREAVASTLEQPGILIIEGTRTVSTESLLKSAARQENLSTEEYLRLLRVEGVDGGLYGGGPELTVLCNILRRPISIYELDEQQVGTNIDIQPIKCKGVFGLETFQDPLFDIPNSAILLSKSLPGAYSWHLHILVLDVSPTEKHACVLLPLGEK
ncbi:predicted protein [Phaeodactylum tricornutum CCAP 1055/1]|jgi:hypothetical protein|uniref:OTU domain-containing protein n=1 Tax=Phaeodactylum tricornutum (strain CCAP 1055/1) TaxID=556484 RepID=B7GA16_PHATC|nr:predicted protein [Phaeodactylum tricornutum CCAP 1055/1]EEC44660.1 predicted protein [Phaeodactylum tricornutum CCAP 1055/1]|eukprot:XP_002183991.1 predicted protein [Phaeodactylum tricornutum CCAP 1055/1]